MFFLWVRVRGNETKSEWEGMRLSERHCEWCVFEFLSAICVLMGWEEIKFQRLIFHKLNQVLWTRFPLNQTESNELDFRAYVDTLSTSTAGKMGKSKRLCGISLVGFALLEMYVGVFDCLEIWHYGQG